MKIPDRLRALVEQGIVQQILRPLMSGKEAAVFLVHAHDEYCIAKVYKEVEHRSFKHRAEYTEGRRVRNSRQQRAMEKGTRFGKEQAEAAWQNAEVDALYRLFDVGVRVPRPFSFIDGVLLMEVILDEDGRPAPRLFDVEFSEEEAFRLHEFLIRQAVWMLCAGLVHGDLSECNVLMAWDGPMIIDLPQATDAARNPNAKALFLRDIENLTRYCARFAPELAETQFGQEIWELYERARLHPDSRLTGRWRGSERQADTRSILREIETAARDARRLEPARDSRPSDDMRSSRHPQDFGDSQRWEEPRTSTRSPQGHRNQRPDDNRRPAYSSSPTNSDRRPNTRSSPPSFERDHSSHRQPNPLSRPTTSAERNTFSAHTSHSSSDFDDLDALLVVEPTSKPR